MVAEAVIDDHSPEPSALPSIGAPILDASGQPVVKRRGRPPGSKNRNPSQRRGGSLENQIGAFLITINAPLTLIPALQREALDPVEIQALAKALDQECQRSARFRKFVEQALAVQGGTSLLLVVSVIAGRRAVRHDVVPLPDDMPKENVDAMLGGLLSMSVTGKPVNPDVVVPTPQAV